MYTINERTPLGHVYGFQIVTGFGVGLFFQNTSMALQAEFKDHPRLVGQGTGLGMFTQFLGGTIGLSIAEAAFSSQLGKNLLKYAPDVDKNLIIESPVNIYTQVASEEVTLVVKAYCKSLDIVSPLPARHHGGLRPVADICTSFCRLQVYLIAVPFAGLMLALVFGIENIDIRSPETLGGKNGDKAVAEKGETARGEERA